MTTARLGQIPPREYGFAPSLDVITGLGGRSRIPETSVSIGKPRRAGCPISRGVTAETLFDNQIRIQMARLCGLA
jgi:hypothetical protein